MMREFLRKLSDQEFLACFVRDRDRTFVRFVIHLEARLSEWIRSGKVFQRDALGCFDYLQSVF